jgi:23S rRNA (cytidine1920-2'-O)/16S rRNA (cytidine1409-2'-O)-methyltransferase
VAATAADTGLAVRGFASSGLPGPKGNRETFIHLARTGTGADSRDAGGKGELDIEAAIAGVEP